MRKLMLVFEGVLNEKGEPAMKVELQGETERLGKVAPQELELSERWALESLRMVRQALQMGQLKAIREQQKAAIQVVK